jgi:DNA polymerase elongation subunit (family B)
MIDNISTIKEIQSFLEGKNNDVKYVVNVETTYDSEYALCVIHDPVKGKELRKIPYTKFLYMKDIEKLGMKWFNGDETLKNSMSKKHGVTIEKLKTGSHSRLEDGYMYILKTDRSYNSIMSYLKDAGLDPYEKQYHDGEVVKDKNGRPQYLYRDLFYMLKTNDQFFISTGIRLFKGIEEYKDLHRVTFDIETTGLRWEHDRIFAIGVRDNRGFEKVLEVEKLDDDDEERKLITKFFNLINKLQPAVISGYNSEMFDYDFILNRGEILGFDPKGIRTTLNGDSNVCIKRIKNASVKFGNSAERYTKTKAWGYTILDILHAVKKTVAVNTDIKNHRLKYICQYEGIAKENRMYIEGSEIGTFWGEDKVFIINPSTNDYKQVPNNLQDSATLFYDLEESKHELTNEEYIELKKKYVIQNMDFIKWVKENTPKIVKNSADKITFIRGKDILRRYLLDDLWETEQVDNLYNQSSFLLAKIVPTTYDRIATMGNAAVWNLLMTTWSFENGLAIPIPDEVERFSGGLARCYKKGYTKRLVKIDYASLYPMIQLTWDVFPMFDITGVIKKMLIYMTTTRNIYKKLAASKSLNDSEVSLLKTTDMDTFIKYENNSFTSEERNLYKVKQLPIKIINNSLFGALGSGFAFNWSDNICAGRITCTGRIYLRQAIDFFKQYGCDPLLAVTDGVNFGIPDNTSIRVTNEGVTEELEERPIEEMWQYGGEVGIGALINKFNEECMPKPFMSVDNDGEFKACLNLSRINYALETNAGKIKFTGNTIKSKTMSEYIEDFIDKGLKLILDGKGSEFVDYYYDYAEDIFYKQIPLKKIASKSKYKMNIQSYLERGTDKNGKMKASQAHMELVIADRERIAKEIFTERFDEFKMHDEELKVLKENNKDDSSVQKRNYILVDDKELEDYTIGEIEDIVSSYMPPEPDLDSMIYYVNVGERKSHADVKKDPNTGEIVIRSKLISQDDLENNPNLTGDYNVEKYLDAFNKRVEVLLEGFDEKIRKDILVKVKREKIKDASGRRVEEISLVKGVFTPDQLVLKNFEHDPYDESMTLEDKEISFWNKTGYDPYNVWNGFNLSDTQKYGLLYPEIYEHALNYVSDTMEKSGKPRVKSVNDKHVKGDFILIKNGKKYSLGYNNGSFIQIARDNLEIPKSPLEEKWELEELERQEKLKKLRLNEEKSIVELREQRLRERDEAIKYFSDFRKQFNIPETETMDSLFKKLPDAEKVFRAFIEKAKASLEPEPIIDEDDI